MRGQVCFASLNVLIQVLKNKFLSQERAVVV